MTLNNGQVVYLVNLRETPGVVCKPTYSNKQVGIGASKHNPSAV